jgi:hypothetical protein
MIRTIAVLALLIAALGQDRLSSQGVLLAPHAVHIDHRVRSGSILLYNPNTQPAEVSISTLFGYPVTDSLGNMRLHVIEQPDSAQPSAAGWLQAFPRRLTVAPLERQTVRLLATPPAVLADGEYWARLVITARGAEVPVTGVADTAIQVGLSLEVRTIIGVMYRKGPLTTGLALSQLRARMVNDSLEIRARLDRRGNAAYVGTVRAEVVDAVGTVRGSISSPLAVYYAMEPRFAAYVGALPAGRYRVRFQVNTDRDDLPPEVVLPAAAVKDSVDLSVP